MRLLPTDWAVLAILTLLVACACADCRYTPHGQARSAYEVAQ